MVTLLVKLGFDLGDTRCYYVRSLIKISVIGAPEWWNLLNSAE